LGKIKHHNWDAREKHCHL